MLENSNKHQSNYQEPKLKSNSNLKFLAQQNPFVVNPKRLSLIDRGKSWVNILLCINSTFFIFFIKIQKFFLIFLL